MLSSQLYLYLSRSYLDYTVYNAYATLERERSISSCVMPLRSHMPWKMPPGMLNRFRGVSNSCESNQLPSNSLRDGRGLTAIFPSSITRMRSYEMIVRKRSE